MYVAAVAVAVGVAAAVAAVATVALALALARGFAPPDSVCSLICLFGVHAQVSFFKISKFDRK